MMYNNDHVMVHGLPPSHLYNMICRVEIVGCLGDSLGERISILFFIHISLGMNKSCMYHWYTTPYTYLGIDIN